MNCNRNNLSYIFRYIANYGTIKTFTWFKKIYQNYTKNYVTISKSLELCNIKTMALSKNYETLIYMYYEELETTDLLWKTMQNYVSISKTMVPDQTINMLLYQKIRYYTKNYGTIPKNYGTLICNGKAMLSYKRL